MNDKCRTCLYCGIEDNNACDKCVFNNDEAASYWKAQMDACSARVVFNNILQHETSQIVKIEDGRTYFTNYYYAALRIAIKALEYYERNGEPKK